MALSVDLNCDCGEGIGNDAALFPLMTSANIACGGHAGSPATMAETCRLAQEWNVAIGAHPGYADRENFGRLVVPMEGDALADLVIRQLEALAQHAPLRHVKPHGALYNLAAADAEVARTVAQAVAIFDRSLVLYALAGSASVRAAEALGIRVAQEVFADRTYRRDGSLTPRTEPHALIEHEERAVEQALRMVHERRVRAWDGHDVAIQADTICIHSDTPQAAALARRVRAALERSGVAVRCV